MAVPARFRSAAVLVLAGMLLAAGCSGDGTTSPTGTETTAAPATTTTVTVPVTGDLDDQYAALVRIAEELRGLTFREDPELVQVPEVAWEERLRQARSDVAPDEGSERFYRFLGLLAPEDDLGAHLGALVEVDVVVRYDATTNEILIGGEHETLSPLRQALVVHQLVAALLEQRYGPSALAAAREDGGDGDGAAALRALAAGDAAYFQFVFFESVLDTEQRSTAALEAAALAGVPDTVPEFLIADWEFPAVAGFEFVAALVADGGSAALDAAYAAPPATSEQVLDPDLYLAGETARPIELRPTPLSGYTLWEAGSLGRWGLEVLFTGLFPPGEVIQAGTGWGGDTYRLFLDGDQIALVLLYQGDTERDAREVTQLFIDHAREVLGAGQGVEDGDGFLFDEGGPYVFLDRAGDRLIVVLASEPSAGDELRALAGAP